MRSINFAINVATLSIAAMLATPAQAIENGPSPTLADIQKDGPYAVTTQQITGSGFRVGTIYVPTAAGKYAVMAISPGFGAAQSSMQKMGQRLATHGFVVVTISTNTLLDFAASRASQLLAVLKAVTTAQTGPVAGKVDASRQAVGGWSMGGGGALEAAAAAPDLKATVAFAPWDFSATKFKSIKIPTCIIGATGDQTAPVSQYAQRYYNAIPSTVTKMLAVIKGLDHFFPTTASEPSSYTNISWMKRFADGDMRYSQFLNAQDPAEVSLTSTGPF